VWLNRIISRNWRSCPSTQTSCLLCKEQIIDSSTPAGLGAHLLGEVPEPVLFNAWKHHAGALQRSIREFAAAGEAGLRALATQLVAQGHELMDLYFGTLTPVEIATESLRQLAAENVLAPEAYGAWIESGGGYRELTFPADESRWVVRLGEVGGRYVHVHPARWAPLTRRVRANVLKTAVLVNAAALSRGTSPLEVKLVNEIRRDFLDLSPVPTLPAGQGLASVISLLQAPNEQPDVGNRR
jgi:hypothetical protein